MYLSDFSVGRIFEVMVRFSQDSCFTGTPEEMESNKKNKNKNKKQFIGSLNFPLFHRGKATFYTNPRWAFFGIAKIHILEAKKKCHGIRAS